MKFSKFKLIFFFLSFFILIYFISAQQSTQTDWTEKIKSYLFSDSKLTTSGAVITTVSRADLEKRLTTLEFDGFSAEYNTTNHGYVEKYLRMGKYFGRIIALSEFYFPLFDEVFERYNIPKEMKYLAIVESKLTVKVTSKAGAKGLWQFMPGTAKVFGLENNAYVDERHDPIKSTEAAAKYFTYLYKYFGSWDMVMAAYNCGEGNLMKAVKKSGGKKNYWQVRNFLPLETRGYVPSFIAASYMMNYYPEHKIKGQKFKYAYAETDTIVVKKRVVLSNLPKLLDMSLEEINFLNPQYKTGIIPKMPGKKYYIRLPKDKYKVFKNNESRIYKGLPPLKSNESQNGNSLEIIGIKEDSIIQKPKPNN